MIPVSVSAYSTYFTEDGFEYTIKNSEAIVVGYSGTDTSLNIPNEINGYSVTEVEDNAFAECTTLTEVKLPYSIKTIGSGTFANCTKLKSINIPYNTNEIGAYALRDVLN